MMPCSVVQGTWRLKTYLQFPWRPLIDILGSTTYTLDPVTSKVCLTAYLLFVRPQEALHLGSHPNALLGKHDLYWTH